MEPTYFAIYLSFNAVCFTDIAVNILQISSMWNSFAHLINIITGLQKKKKKSYPGLMFFPFLSLSLFFFFFDCVEHFQS